MVTRNVVLTNEQAELVESLVSSGRFQNASEALRAGLRLLEHEERQVVELRERLKKSLSQADNSEFVHANGKDAVRNIFASVRASQI